MSKEPFLPLFVGDFFGATMRLTPHAKAYYLLMLAHQWASGPFPESWAQTGRLLGVERKFWGRLEAELSPKFPVQNGVRFNPTLEEHRKKSFDLSERRTNAGRTAGLASAKARSQRFVDDSSQLRQPSIPSHPNLNPDVSDNSKNLPPVRKSFARALSEADDREVYGWICRIKAAYPEGGGRQDWITGEKHIRQLVIDGEATFESLLEATERYGKYCKATGRIILNPANFFGAPDKPWSQKWMLPEGQLSGRKKTLNEEGLEALAAARKRWDEHERVVSEQSHSANGVGSVEQTPRLIR